MSYSASESFWRCFSEGMILRRGSFGYCFLKNLLFSDIVSAVCNQVVLSFNGGYNGSLLKGNRMKEVLLYTDGACSGNPGPGGWAAVLIWGKHRKEISGGYRLTTNNRMEILAVIEGLKLLNRPCEVRVISDSRLLVDAFDKRWIQSWQENNWKKSDKTPVKNPELWVKLLSICREHKVRFEWIKAHNGHPENERCDRLAVAASQKENLPADEVYEREANS